MVSFDFRGTLTPAMSNRRLPGLSEQLHSGVSKMLSDALSTGEQITCEEMALRLISHIAGFANPNTCATCEHYQLRDFATGYRALLKMDCVKVHGMHEPTADDFCSRHEPKRG